MPLSSIALKLGSSREKVAKCISNYKKQVRALIKLNKLRAAARKRIVKDDKQEEVKRYWQINAHRPLKLFDIKTGVWRNDQAAQLDSTLSHVLRKKIGMSYRVLSMQPPKTITKDLLKSYCESVMTQCILEEKGYECVYIDEFHISGHRNKFKGWSF